MATLSQEQRNLLSVVQSAIGDRLALEGNNTKLTQTCLKGLLTEKMKQLNESDLREAMALLT